MTRDLAHVPLALLHALKHYKVLHKRVVMMQVETEDVPHVPDEQRLEISELGKGFYTIRLRYGFMDAAERRAGPRAMPGRRPALQPDGDVLHYRPREVAAAARAARRFGAGATGSSS